MSLKKAIKVLLIENNSGDQILVKNYLSTDCPGKFEIDCCTDLKTALALVNECNYDVILTDLNLPDANDMQVVEEIQRIKPGMPMVVITGNDSEELAMRILKSGAQDYLIKGQSDGYLIGRVIRYAIERKQIERGLLLLAQHDSLTGLANRALFRERLGRALVRAERNQNLAGLMFIDLDRFKNINDTLGHDAGDQLLVEVGGRLKSCLREMDTVARLGGDEFTIILEDIKTAEAAATVARKIIEVMALPVYMDGQEIFVTPSIGITLYPLDDKTEEGLLKNADTAMYQAKEQGRNSYQFYTSSMNTQSIGRLQLEAKLRKALHNGEFVLYYQPKIDLQTGLITGAEALIRWKNPEAGMISPGDFIPLAEETGLIIPMGEWVIKTACEQISAWQKMQLQPIKVAVNLSARQFRETSVVNVLMDHVRRTGISPHNLEVEMTESMLIDDSEFSNIVLKEIKKQGIYLAIDDFGTGYSSLSYLKRFKIDTLKIDQSFVRDITTDPDDAAIASAIIALGRNLRLNVVAEGVESEEQLEFLRTNGCNEAQGYYFSKPIPAEDFTKFLHQYNAKQIPLRAVKFNMA